MLKIGQRVIITNGFFATDEAKDLALKKGIKEWNPIGTIIKLPSENSNEDEIIYKEESGEKYDMFDFYRVKLDKSPFLNNIVTHLCENDIKLI